ncbi:DUF234 domain-containing protein [Streptomyces alboniger]|uniref:DUF234 domain-containing protein n=1 Tax=Streptomyces alboniger TaxID=132473 RepID=UPI001FE7626C|nr:DUF234 domain-containing protein [Streptomyces alboniger]
MIPLIERGRGDLALERIERSWTTWRVRAVEPLIRESLLRLMANDEWPETEAIGGWWNRQNNPRSTSSGHTASRWPGRCTSSGRSKWLENQPFGRHEYDALVRDVLDVPGAGPDTPLVAVSRCGVAGNLPHSAHWGPEDLVRTWQPR